MIFSSKCVIAASLQDHWLVKVIIIIIIIIKCNLSHLTRIQRRKAVCFRYNKDCNNVNKVLIIIENIKKIVLLGTSYLKSVSYLFLLFYCCPSVLVTLLSAAAFSSL